MLTPIPTLHRLRGWRSTDDHASQRSNPDAIATTNWDTRHLADAATHWDQTADLWDDVFNEAYQGVLRPGGTVWEGEAADQAQDRSWNDLVKVRGSAEKLREAAKIARAGAGDISAAKQLVLSAVDDARAAGFHVGEDLSVTDRKIRFDAAERAAVQAQAEAHAAHIRLRAFNLVGLDEEIASKITTATAGFTGFGDFTPLSTFSPPPDAILVWCIGVPGGFLCTDYHPGGGISTYPSPIDESGVKNHWPG